MAVKEAGERAVAHCRAGNGPYLLEMKTYRYRGHSMSDPAKYRTREEVQKMREQSDPIETARKALLEQGVTEADLKKIDDEVKASSRKPPISRRPARSRTRKSSGPISCIEEAR